MTKSSYHEQLEARTLALRSAIADEKAFQVALNEALERQYAALCEVFDSKTAELLAVLQGGAS